jgi:hypothetical protein
MRLLNLFVQPANQGKKRLNIDKLLSAEDLNDSIIQLDDYVSNLCEFGLKVNLLSDPQKIFYCIQNCEREIHNGGFKQFYYNSSGDFAHETYYSLRVVGAYKTAEIVVRANDQFPGRAVPKERADRQKILEQMEGESDEVWKELDQLFINCDEELNTINLEFIRKNKNFF